MLYQAFLPNIQWRLPFHPYTAATSTVAIRAQPPTASHSRTQQAKTRVLGHVAYTSRYEVGSLKFLSDWCLIRLEADSHERTLSELSNDERKTA
ncbi:hypothetical protein LY76DRAFT_195781 [Colletotrichum caudatum]|nr:hypothetical protein LY76DRAFT_195781 [Colletotrichum caudatum]